MYWRIGASVVLLCVFAAIGCDQDDGDDSLDPDDHGGGDGDGDGDADVEQCSGGMYDNSAGVCWEEPASGGNLNWDNAHHYCDSLELADENWLVPSLSDFTEMLGGCDDAVAVQGSEGFCNSCAESATCTALFGQETRAFWTRDYTVLDNAWRVDLGTGYVSFIADTNYQNVRCMRRGSSRDISAMLELAS